MEFGDTKQMFEVKGPFYDSHSLTKQMWKKHTL